MKTGILFLLILILPGFACQNVSKKGELKVITESNSDSKEYFTKSGKMFLVDIDHSMGASICTVEVETKGFDIANTTHKLGTLDPVKNIFLSDLDDNGFEEIYLITQSAGSGSYVNIYGIASNKDKSTSPVYVRPVSEKQMEKGGLFEGFMGHNNFSLQNNKLINSFPVYKNEDSNAKPTGGNKKIEYRLIAGEAGWILEPFQQIK
jgi:hypothetical protein